MYVKKKCSKGKKQVDGQEENAVLCKQTSISVHNIDDPKFLLVSPITPALQWLHAEAAQQRQQLGSSALIITLHSSCLAFMVWYISEPSSLGLCQKLFFFLFINQFNASLIILMECERKHLCPMTSTVSLGSSILVYLKKIQTRSNKLKGANRTLISFIPENSDLLLSAQLLP